MHVFCGNLRYIAVLLAPACLAWAGSAAKMLLVSLFARRPCGVGGSVMLLSYTNACTMLTSDLSRHRHRYPHLPAHIHFGPLTRAVSYPSLLSTHW